MRHPPQALVSLKVRETKRADVNPTCIQDSALMQFKKKKRGKVFLFHLYRNIHIWTHARRQGTARTGSWGQIGTEHGPSPIPLLSPCNMVFAA